MTINILFSPHFNLPVAFAAQELSRCLAEIVADSIIILNKQNCREEFTIRLESQEQPSNSEDAYSICITPAGGTISGTNDRSVLLGVYQYLWLLGCRFPAPGRKHESLPTLYKKEQLSACCRKKAALRHRGVCIEGANSLENILDFIDWLPKLGYNSFFLQFQLPYTFMARWYHHELNPLLKPENFTRETAADYTAQIEAELQKRGLLLHQAGHGWTGDILGFPCADWKAISKPLPPEKIPFAACVDGKRELFHGVPMNTNLCYSNHTVMEEFSERVAEYCAQHPAISYVHVWLADEFNNICECSECRTELPTDQYVRLLNEIDKKLTRQHLDTKIVFLLYQELLWPPIKEALKNQNRFLLMFAPISRTFEQSYQLRDSYGPVPAYERNRIVLPAGLEENMVFLKSWQKTFHGESFVFDYPLGRAHYGDFGYIHIAEIIGQDIRKLKQMGLEGYISCQELRVCLPNAFPGYVMGRMLFDSDVTFEELKKEYFSAAYGAGWEDVLAFLTELSSMCSCDYFNGKESRKDQKEADSMKNLVTVLERARLSKPAGADGLTAVQNLFWKYLDYHREYSLRLGKALMNLAGENEQEAQECWQYFQRMICEHEMEFQECLDVYRVTEVATKYTGFHLDEQLIATL